MESSTVTSAQLLETYTLIAHMQDPERNCFESFLDLAKFWKERHDKRTEYEWKVILAVWAVLLAAIVGLQQAERDTIFAIVCWIFGLVFLFWLWALHRANYIDRKKAYHFALEAQILAENNLKRDEGPFEPDKKPLPFNWGVIMQAMITVMLLLILYYVRVPIGPPDRETPEGSGGNKQAVQSATTQS